MEPGLQDRESHPPHELMESSNCVDGVPAKKQPVFAIARCRPSTMGPMLAIASMEPITVDAGLRIVKRGFHCGDGGSMRTRDWGGMGPGRSLKAR
jgi:hypothetical protein